MKAFTKDHARELIGLLKEATGMVEDLRNTRPLAFKGYQGENFLARAYEALERSCAPAATTSGSASNRPCTQAEAAYWERLEKMGDPEQKISLR